MRSELDGWTSIFLLQVEDNRVGGQTRDLSPAQMRQTKTVMKQGMTINVNEDR